VSAAPYIVRVLVLGTIAMIAACAQRASAEDPWPRCRATVTTPLVKLGAMGAVEACRDLFPPACRDAMATAHAGLTEDEGRAILAACGDLEAALATLGTPRERQEVGSLLAMELLPMKSLVARIAADRISLDGGGSWPLSTDFADFIAAARAAGAAERGVLIWGLDDAPPDTRRAFLHAMSAANLELVSCVRSGANCR
jgi:hypothetical protein